MPMPLLSIAAVSSILISLLSLALVLLRKPKKIDPKAERSEANELIMGLKKQVESQAAQARDMASQMDEMRRRLEDSAAAKQQNPVWRLPDASINLNSRGQVLRLSRKGRSVAEIAEDLQVSPGEVAFILKVHDLTQDNPVTSGTGEATESVRFGR